eukprot:4547199-Pyramimonas_sp.AAC.1
MGTAIVPLGAAAMSTDVAVTGAPVPAPTASPATMSNTSRALQGAAIVVGVSATVTLLTCGALEVEGGSDPAGRAAALHCKSSDNPVRLALSQLFEGEWNLVRDRSKRGRMESLCHTSRKRPSGSS